MFTHYIFLNLLNYIMLFKEAGVTLLVKPASLSKRFAVRRRLRKVFLFQILWALQLPHIPRGQHYLHFYTEAYICHFSLGKQKIMARFFRELGNFNFITFFGIFFSKSKFQIKSKFLTQQSIYPACLLELTALMNLICIPPAFSTRSVYVLYVYNIFFTLLFFLDFF